MIDAVNEKLCPKCGAYWKCDCVLDVVELRPRDLERLTLPATPGCQHDWTEAVGVDLDDDLLPGESEVQVMVCRLCGLYAVEDKSA
jgi:hypothetical protein